MTQTWTDRKVPTTICLFDVDGTLTPARKTISPEMMDTLKRLRQHCVIGFVGGSDLSKQIEQLGQEGKKPLF
jgi:phosphomannomutase